MAPFLRRLFVSDRAKMPVRSVHAYHRDGFITKEAVEHDNIDAINLTSVPAAQVDHSPRDDVVTTVRRSDRYPDEMPFIRGQPQLESRCPASVYLFLRVRG